MTSALSTVATGCGVVEETTASSAGAQRSGRVRGVIDTAPKTRSSASTAACTGGVSSLTALSTDGEIARHGHAVEDELGGVIDPPAKSSALSAGWDRPGASLGDAACHGQVPQGQ